MTNTAGTAPVQQRAEVVSLRTVGAYAALQLAAPRIGQQAQPGHFAALAVGGPDTPMLLRRCFSLARWDSATIEVVLSVVGRGTAWLARRRPGDVLDVIGPLGRPFELPSTPAPCVLVGGGYGAAPLVPLARALRARGCPVHVVLGAASADRLLGVVEATAEADAVTVTTDDGSAGTRGWVSDVLPGVLDGAGTVSPVGAVYACGPMAMLSAVARLAAAAGVPSQVAVEESMACGVGVCMTCVLPVVADDGRTRMVRSCLEGPVFAGARVRFDAVGMVPADAVRGGVSAK